MIPLSDSCIKVEAPLGLNPPEKETLQKRFFFTQNQYGNKNRIFGTLKSKHFWAWHENSCSNSKSNEILWYGFMKCSKTSVF